MSGPHKVQRQPDRRDLVAAAVEQNREIWVRMAIRITHNRQDAEDAVHEAVTRVLAGSGNLPDADSAGRYLTRSVSHCAIDRVRARGRLTSFAESPDEPGPRPTSVDADQESRLLASEAAKLEARKLKRILRALSGLPDKQRQAVEMFILRDPPLKLREASEETGAPISTLHSRLKAALENLRQILSENPGQGR